METHFQRARHALAAVWLLAVALASSNVCAGMLPVDDSIPNFFFKNGQIQYSASLDSYRLELTATNQVELKLPGDDGDPTTSMSPDGLEAELRLRVDTRDGRLLDGDFNIFGSLRPAEEESSAELVEATLSAMAVKQNGDNFEFMFVGDRVNGTLAQQYRSIGVYATAVGLEETVWASNLAQGSLMNLVLADQGLRAAGSGSAPAAPAPGTALLLLGALPLLALRRRRR